MAKKDIILGGVKYESIDKIIVKEDLTNNDVEFFDISQEENLVPENIKDGVTIFGVEGDYEGEGGGGLVPGQAISPFPVMFLYLKEIWRFKVYQADDINGTNESLFYDKNEYINSATIVIPLIVNKYYKVVPDAEVVASSGKIIKYNTRPLSIEDWSIEGWPNTETRKKAEETTAMFVQCWDAD